MTYSIDILERARREVGRLPQRPRNQVTDAIRRLGADPRPPGCLKLRGREGWRIRIGDYRALYVIDDERRLVTIVSVGHRREVYR